MYGRINENTLKASGVFLHLTKRKNGQKYGTSIEKNIAEPLIIHDLYVLSRKDVQ